MIFTFDKKNDCVSRSHRDRVWVALRVEMFLLLHNTLLLSSMDRLEATAQRFCLLLLFF